MHHWHLHTSEETYKAYQWARYVPHCRYYSHTKWPHPSLLSYAVWPWPWWPCSPPYDGNSNNNNNLNATGNDNNNNITHSTAMSHPKLTTNSQVHLNRGGQQHRGVSCTTMHAAMMQGVGNDIGKDNDPPLTNNGWQQPQWWQGRWWWQGWPWGQQHWQQWTAHNQPKVSRIPHNIHSLPHPCQQPLHQPTSTSTTPSITPSSSSTMSRRWGPQPRH